MIRINLLPTKKALKIPPVFIYGTMATAALIVVLIMFTFYLFGKVSAMQTEISKKEKRLEELKIMIKEVQNYEKDNEEFRKKTEIIEQLKKNQIVPLRLLDEVSGMLPKGVWLTILNEKSGVTNIEGYAHTNNDLVTYVQNLKGSKYLTDVMLIESRQTTIDEFEVYKFKLTFKIRI
ncbi:MAG: PilN domain-containing protein [Nitrospirae bacterium]|nr:PilN domain-containing protein [Nitrospirota bacterium]